MDLCGAAGSELQMEFADAVERPSWLIGTGFAVQLIGGAMVAVELSDRAKVAQGVRSAGNYRLGWVLVGAVIGWIGLWIALLGVIAFAARFLAYRDAPAAAPTPARWRPGPPQVDPADVKLDPRPFIKHDDDTQVVADVRRACGSGVRRSGIQRIVARAEREGRLTDHDRVMVQALIDEASKRPLAPVAPDDFL
jgi:hypothetical protein